MYMDKLVKNYSFEPDLRIEGTYICPMPQPPAVSKSAPHWHSDLSSHDRLFYHQTMSSVRYSKRFRANANIPKDSLDFQLQARYDHSRETFPEKIDAVLQRDTCPAHMSWSAPHGQKEIGSVTSVNVFRVLRNTRVERQKMPAVLGHPLIIGGIKEKVHPSSVKLICSGVHTQLVNNGFSRQTSDGNFFRY